MRRGNNTLCKAAASFCLPQHSVQRQAPQAVVPQEEQFQFPQRHKPAGGDASVHKGGCAANARTPHGPQGAWE